MASYLIQLKSKPSLDFKTLNKALIVQPISKSPEPLVSTKEAPRAGLQAVSQKGSNPVAIREPKISQPRSETTTEECRTMRVTNKSSSQKGSIAPKRKLEYTTKDRARYPTNT